MSFTFDTPKTLGDTSQPPVLNTTSTTGFTLGNPINASGDAKVQVNLFGVNTTSNNSNLSFGSISQPTSETICNTSIGTATLSFGTPSTATVTPNKLCFTPTTSTSVSTSSFTPILGTSTSSLSSPTKKTSSASTIPISNIITTSISSTTITPSFTSIDSGVSSTKLDTFSGIGSLTYAQLEDSINKWTVDLEEQGKFFINQAKQLNAWDNLLISNGDKILNLNETIERVKQQQKHLDQELDFILAQQKELDELSEPLEKKLNDLPIADQNRFQMYQTAETIDTQLKQMSDDLKEIIENLNESNKNEDISDPIVQVSRILNAHMNSLQWIDHNTTEISVHLEQISKMQEMNKKNYQNY